MVAAVGNEKMKEQKPLTTGPSEHDGPVGPIRGQWRSARNGAEAASVGSAGAGAHEAKADDANRYSDPQAPRTTRPGVQTKLGKTLQAYFDDVLKEGVPDRFKDLLQQYDERKDKGSN